MENASPVVEAAPKAQPVENEVEQNKKLAEILATVQYLLTAGSYQGKDAEMVSVAKQFVIDFRAHLLGQKK